MIPSIIIICMGQYVEVHPSWESAEASYTNKDRMVCLPPREVEENEIQAIVVSINEGAI